MKGEIARKVQFLRKRESLTQAELSKGICTQAQISNIEKGVLNPSSLTLFHIAQRLKVDMNYFFYQQLDYPTHSQVIQNNLRLLALKEDFQAIRDQLNTLHETNEDPFALWHEALCLYYLDGSYEKAIEQLSKAYENSTMAKRYQLNMLSDLGFMYVQLNIFEEAFFCFDTLSQELNKQDGNVECKRLLICANLGKAYVLFSTHQYGEAEECCLVGEGLCIDYKILAGLSELFDLHGKSLLKRGEYTKAYAYISKARNVYAIENKQEEMAKMEALLTVCQNA
ncbi:helix-turn-helix domain-containing protein [Alkalihalobacillus sp. LMS6]|uniref:helix-turn-helix domain-containing protein n=1 Tax=Alkalihalobacillus sp. LMS6 TaxID=2924034 RepID=UPI0020D1F3E0|nr:helix-turn-helix transcriptional regulator [Alkalihalobacillus sp. LMS6]UTR04587.1 helix-turn-helix domain-containing protein [Alkalihalobacillus sp. LMS6]